MKAMKRYFQLSIHALILTAFLALAMTGRLDLTSIIVFSAAAACSVYRTVKGNAAGVTARTAFVLALISVFLSSTSLPCQARSFQRPSTSFYFSN